MDIALDIGYFRPPGRDFCEKPPIRHRFYGRGRQRIRYLHPTSETTSNAAALDKEFDALVKVWQDSTGGYSVTKRRYAHQSYQTILTLEPKREVIKLILAELQKRPDWWFEALQVLTKENPVKPGSTFDEAISAWLEWGKNY